MTKYTPENEVKIILHTVSQQLIFSSTHMHVHVLTCQGEQIAKFTVRTLVGFLEPLSIVFGW